MLGPVTHEVHTYSLHTGGSATAHATALLRVSPRHSLCHSTAAASVGVKQARPAAMQMHHHRLTQGPVVWHSGGSGGARQCGRTIPRPARAAASSTARAARRSPRAPPRGPHPAPTSADPPAPSPAAVTRRRHCRHGWASGAMETHPSAVCGCPSSVGPQHRRDHNGSNGVTPCEQMLYMQTPNDQHHSCATLPACRRRSCCSAAATHARAHGLLPSTLPPAPVCNSQQS